MRPARAQLLCLLHCLALAALIDPARAEERGFQFVPEMRAFVKLSERTRLYLYGNATHDNRRDVAEGEVGAHLDYTLMPILRRQLRDANWERDRYLWIRGGVVRGSANGLRGVFRGSTDDQGKSGEENSLLLEATARLELPGDFWLVNRARMDRRDLAGASYKRYRLRLGIEREFVVNGVTMVPYVQAEAFYDSRFDTWNRQLYEAGVEIELSKTWRIEPYVSRQNDQRSASANFNAVGIVLKWYH